MISKKLLKNVLYGESIDNISIISNDITFEYSHYVNGVFQYRRKTDINIYELAHKCKEWALSKGYIINSGATTSNDWSSTIYKVIKENPYIKELSHTWGQSENEAIFRACQWILTKDSK